MAAKKKRSAKQLANDKRLGRMAKARAKKKRRSKKKTTRKKATRRRTNTAPLHKRGPTRRRKKLGTRKRRGTRKTRTRDYVVFKCNGSAVHYLSMTTSGKRAWTATRERALHWTSRKVAERIAMNYRTATGVASSSTSKTEIANYCKGK